MKVYDFQQGEPEWIKIRLGKLTASSAQAIATNGKGLETLCFEKVAERLTGKPKLAYTNEDMERGHELENIARGMYEIETGNTVEQVGFVEADEYSGCSPDGFVGEDGLMEIKCKNDTNFVKHLYHPEVDSEYQWQVQMQMLVTDRKWCDFVVFNENFEKSIHIIRVNRDERMIETLKAGIQMGTAQIKTILEKVK